MKKKEAQNPFQRNTRIASLEAATFPGLDGRRRRRRCRRQRRRRRRRRVQKIGDD